MGNEIYIDGVNVAGCMYYKNTSPSGCYYENKNHSIEFMECKKNECYYKQLQRLLATEAASVYLQDPALLTAVNKNLGGYTFYPVFAQDMSLIYYKE